MEIEEYRPARLSSYRQVEKDTTLVAPGSKPRASNGQLSRSSSQHLSTGQSLSSSITRRPPWVEHWWRTVSSDNDTLHPHHRHYFDQRGLETSYRTRPELDQTSPVYRRRTPRHVGFIYKAITQPGQSADASGKLDPNDLIAGKYVGNTFQWKDRCRMFGTDVRPKSSNGDDKVPWVCDHHILESEDNTILNPVMRHYFSEHGLESSFRNRGRQSGRPIKAPPVRNRPTTAP